MKILYLTMVLVLISSCSSGGKIVDKTYYRFPTAQQSLVEKKYNIERPTAMSILGNRPMVAQDLNGGLIQMSHNLWIESPKILLEQYLNEVFNSSQDDGVNRLQSHILNFEKKGLASILTIKFTLVNQENHIIFSKTYNDEENLESNSIPEFVRSISTSLKKMTIQLINDLP